MSEIAGQDARTIHGAPPMDRARVYVDAYFRTPELANLLTWIRQGPGTALVWHGERWERAVTPKQHLAMATCKDLDLKVLQQNPNTETKWAKLAREGHDVWQVIAGRRYLGVIVDGVYSSYDEER